MLYKRNFILSENIIGFCRVICFFIIFMLENVVLWYERDMSYSFVECFVLFDLFIISDFMFSCLNSVIENLVVYFKNMFKNLVLSGGLVFL